MSALYTRIMGGVLTQVAALASVRAQKAQVVLRKKPEWIGLQDALPQVVIACPAGIAERRGPGGGQHMVDCADLLFGVYVGTFFLASWDPADLDVRLGVREDVRGALWSPRALAVPPASLSIAGLYDVDYDPEPGAPRTWDEEKIDGSWQLFTFTATVTRSTNG